MRMNRLRKNTTKINTKDQYNTECHDFYLFEDHFVLILMFLFALQKKNSKTINKIIIIFRIEKLQYICYFFCVGLLTHIQNT